MQYISTIPAKEDSLPFPRRLAIMGSTGSIGRNALRVVEAMPDRFVVTALAGGHNLALLAEQANRWRPSWVALCDAAAPIAPTAPAAPTAEDALTPLLDKGYCPHILTGPEGFAHMAALPEVDVVLSAQSGAAGLRATVAAAEAGKMICLANKESLVMAGDLLRELCAITQASILPVDSEHYALFQCLAGRDPQTVSRLLLTASGGPFRGRDAAFLKKVRPAEALRHPNWNMGAKISIDSATLMNKGLEIIEACRLYDMPVEQVDVLVHPQSLVHSLVEFGDASLLAQLATPDMRLPIAACLCWPLVAQGSGISLLDLAKAGTLHFEAPDETLFPCLNLARRALAQNLTVELNAANEVAVARFLAEDIAFTHIPCMVEGVLDDMGAHAFAPLAALSANALSASPQSFVQPSISPQLSVQPFVLSAHNTGSKGSLALAIRQAVDALEQRDTKARALAEHWRP